MHYLLTSQQFADEMNASLPPDAPSITTRKVSSWVACGLIRDFSTTKRAGFHPEDVEAFIASHPYKVLPVEYLRVSLVEMRPDRIQLPLNGTIKTYRTHAGYDGANRLGLTRDMARRAITSIWPVAESRAIDLADRNVPLIGTVKGAVELGMAYTIVDYTRHEGRTIFHTRPAKEDVISAIGAGALIDVPAGQIAEVVTPDLAASTSV
jgi:hypothetical protein